MALKIFYQSFTIFALFFQVFENSILNWDKERRQLTFNQSRIKHLTHLIGMSLLAFCSTTSIVLLLCREIFVTTSYPIPIENIIILVATFTFNLYTIVFFIASVYYEEEFVCSWNAAQLISAAQEGNFFNI